jgi:RimJ/RimL family protein N-acetyltransferase
MYTLEPAGKDDLDLCVSILREGRAFQQEQGFTQWTDDYPNPTLIENDIREQQGYLFKIDGEAAGYMYLSFDGDPTYPDIEGAWRANLPYAVVHRIAFSRRFAGRGLSTTAFGAVQNLCEEKGFHSIRIDTDKKNARMQHVLEKNGFVFCGYVLFAGDKKWAYEKLF